MADLVGEDVVAVDFVGEDLVGGRTKSFSILHLTATRSPTTMSSPTRSPSPMEVSCRSGWSDTYRSDHDRIDVCSEVFLPLGMFLISSLLVGPCAIGAFHDERRQVTRAYCAANRLPPTFGVLTTPSTSSHEGDRYEQYASAQRDPDPSPDDRKN